jgi:tripartite-type tricarboxylate transporter receptor subunit TctC
MLMRTIIRIVAAIAAAGAVQAFAQGYPNKPVHVMITFPPGSGTDIVGRIVTQKLSEFWGQPVVVENRGGAGGSIGAAVVAKAAPDGYTLMINSNAHNVNPAIYAKLPYDTLKDFVEIAPLAGAPNVLIVSSSSKLKSLADLLAEARANPGKMNFASAGVGSGTHLNLESFKLATHIDVTHIPYKGTQEVMSDLLGERVAAYFSPISPAIPFIRDNRVRPLAVTSAKRQAAIPNVPTVAESGVPGYVFTLWFGMWAPAGISADLVDKINKDVNRALASADVVDRLAKVGQEPMIMSPAEFRQLDRKEVDEYARVIKAAGIKPQ